MPLFFHVVEKLSHDFGYDYNGSDTAPFNRPKTISGGSVYRYRSGPHIVEREVLEGFCEGETV